MVGAGKIGFTSVPLGATIFLGLNRPALGGMFPYLTESKSIERKVRYIAISTVPTKGIFIGRSICGSVPVRSTVISLSFIITETTIFKSFLFGSLLSKYPSIKPSALYFPSGNSLIAFLSKFSEYFFKSSFTAFMVFIPYLLTSSIYLSSPILADATCASISPTTTEEFLILSRRISHTYWFFLPLS